MRPLPKNNRTGRSCFLLSPPSLPLSPHGCSPDYPARWVTHAPWTCPPCTSVALVGPPYRWTSSSSMEAMRKSRRSWHRAALGSGAMDAVLLHGGDDEEQKVVAPCGIGARRHGHRPHHGCGPLQASVVMGESRLDLEDHEVVRR
jgi:hypothetical protein